MQTDDGFFREGLQRWGRAQLIVSTFEDKLRAELTRIGKELAENLGIQVTGTTPRTFGRGASNLAAEGTRPSPGIRVEVEGRIGRIAVELIVGVEWHGTDLRGQYYSGFWKPADLASLAGCVSSEEKARGVDIMREEKRDWCVLEVGELGPDEAFGILRKVLQRRLDTRP